MAEETPVGSHSNLTLRLACGHWVEVPVGAPVPAMVSCVFEHEIVCQESPIPETLERPLGPLPPTPLAVVYR